MCAYNATHQNAANAPQMQTITQNAIQACITFRHRMLMVIAPAKMGIYMKIKIVYV